MALNPRYFVSLGLEDYLVDPDSGLPLSNGYIECYKDNQRATPKPVFQLTGNPPDYTYASLPNPVQLSATGNPMNANGDIVKIYYYPWDDDLNLELYYLEIYDVDGVLKYEIQATPNLTARDNPSFSTNVYENQLSNSQFSEVLFRPDLGMDINITTAVSNVEYPIAPDWTLVVSTNGAANISVDQIGIEGAVNAPTNPPFVAQFQSSGNVTSLQLVQRLNNNPDIWSTTTAQAGYVSGYMLVSSLDGLPHSVSMYYSPSVAASPQVIVTGSTGISGYKELSGYVELEAGANSEDGFDGYVDIIIDLPRSANIYLSSVQVVGLGTPIENVPYSQETVNRQVDHLFHYYKNPLEFKPIESYLVGWDFPVNPRQFGSSGTMTVQSQYIIDQTIGYQSVNSAFSYATSPTEGLGISCLLDASFALIQYIAIDKEVFNSELSININMGANLSASVKSTVSLWYNKSFSAPDINSGLSIVSTLDSDGYPSSFNGSWTEIPRGSLGNATFMVENTSSYVTLDYGFNGFNVDDKQDAYDSAIWIAVVVGFDGLIAADYLNFMSVSMVPGSIPTRPQPKTVYESLTQCQKFYQRSYAIGTPTGTNTYNNALYFNQVQLYDGGAGGAVFAPGLFQVDFISPMLIESPEVHFYSALSGGTLDQVTVSVIQDGSYPSPTSGTNPKNVSIGGNWGGLYVGTDRITLFGANVALMSFATGTNGRAQTMLVLHYTADSRIGTF